MSSGWAGTDVAGTGRRAIGQKVRRAEGQTGRRAGCRVDECAVGGAEEQAAMRVGVRLWGG